jgi:hypothetical protein
MRRGDVQGLALYLGVGALVWLALLARRAIAV